MLNRTVALYRIGVFLDPTHAGFGRLTIDSDKTKIVPTSDISTENGYHFGISKRQQLQYEEEEYDRKNIKIIESIENDGNASYDNAAKLISVGGVDTGLNMFEFLDKKTPANGKQLNLMIESLSIPKLVEQWRSLSEGFKPEALKRAGSHRGHQRSREADYFLSLLLKRTSKSFDETLRTTAFNNVLAVYCSCGYEAVNEVADRLYDQLFEQKIQPNAITYSHILTGLGLTNRMNEFDSLWSWLSSTGTGRLPIIYSAVIDGYLESERYLDVHQTISDMKINSVIPSADDVNSVVLAIWKHSRSSGGTIPASEEKRLIFIPSLARESGVHFSDIAEINQQRVEEAIKRWTYRRGLSKTTIPMLDDKKHEYESWCEGQRWKHLGEDDINTSIIESGIRKMRGDEIDQRMRLDVERGGGRGVIYPPKPEKAVTRFDAVSEIKDQILWDRTGVSSSLHGTSYTPASDHEVWIFYLFYYYCFWYRHQREKKKKKKSKINKTVSEEITAQQTTPTGI